MTFITLSDVFPVLSGLSAYSTEIEFSPTDPNLLQLPCDLSSGCIFSADKLGPVSSKVITPSFMLGSTSINTASSSSSSSIIIVLSSLLLLLLLLLSSSSLEQPIKIVKAKRLIIVNNLSFILVLVLILVLV